MLALIIVWLRAKFRFDLDKSRINAELLKDLEVKNAFCAILKNGLVSEKEALVQVGLKT